MLDQFLRNVWRDTDHPIAQDALALALAQETVAHGDDVQPENLNIVSLPPLSCSPLRNILSASVHADNRFAPGLENDFNFERSHLGRRHSTGSFAWMNTSSQPAWHTFT